MNFKTSKYFAVIMVFIIIPFFLDQVDGFVNQILLINFPVSKIYKTPTMLYAMGYVFFYDKARRYSMMLLIYLVFFVISTVLNVYDLYSDLGKISTDLGYLLKIFSLPILYFYFVTFHKNNPFPNDEFIRKMFLFLFFSFSLAILFSFFGFGIAFYGTTDEGEAIGQQGYFASGNEVSGMFLLFASMFYFYVFRSYSILYMFLGLAFGVGVGVLMSSKTAIASALICFLGNYFLVKIYDRKMHVINKVDASLLLTLVGIVSFVIIFISPIMEIIQPIIGHFIYRYKISGDLITFLTSGRLRRAEAVLNNYTNNYTIPHLLFGEGYSYSNLLKIPNTRYSKAEMDFPDILSISGLIGVTMIYFFWLYIWLVIFRKYIQRKSELAIPCVMALAILIINSNISGHIIYSGVVNPPLAYLAAYILNKPRNNVGPQYIDRTVKSASLLTSQL